MKIYHLATLVRVAFTKVWQNGAICISLTLQCTRHAKITQSNCSGTVDRLGKECESTSLETKEPFKGSHLASEAGPAASRAVHGQGGKIGRILNFGHFLKMTEVAPAENWATFYKFSICR
jgi:hypothetical protein